MLFWSGSVWIGLRLRCPPLRSLFPLLNMFSLLCILRLPAITSAHFDMNRPTLLDPVRIGAWDLPTRIILAPLPRQRAGVERLPNALMAEYYRQRASAGLIISEATSVSPMGVGYADTPGIWSAEQ